MGEGDGSNASDGLISSVLSVYRGQDSCQRRDRPNAKAISYVVTVSMIISWDKEKSTTQSLAATFTIIIQIIIMDPKACNFTKWNLKVSISMLRNQVSLRKIIFSHNFISLLSVFHCFS